MKNFTKICLILCLAFTCAGAICICIGMALGSGPREVLRMVEDGHFQIGNWQSGGWNFFDEENESPTTQEATENMLTRQFPVDEIDDLEIDIRYGEVRLVTGEGSQIEIRIDTTTDHVFECEKDDRTLILKDQATGKWWRNGLNRHAEITISLPQGSVFQEVELTTDAGKVEISHSLAAKEVSLELGAGALFATDIVAEDELSADVGAGQLAIESFSAKTIAIDCGLGNVELGGRLSGDADIKCGMGHVDLRLLAAETDYDYAIHCGLGSVKLNGQNFTSLDSEKEFDNHAGREISLDCGLGELIVTTEQEE